MKIFVIDDDDLEIFCAISLKWSLVHYSKQAKYVERVDNSRIKLMITGVIDMPSLLQNS